MKISEMTNEQATEALIRLSTPISNICNDDTTLELLNSFGEMGKQPLIQTVGALLPKIVLGLLKTHKHDVYEIIGTLAGVSSKEVAKMNFVQTVQIIKDSYDEVLLSFFTSSVKQIKPEEMKSSTP